MKYTSDDEINTEYVLAVLEAEKFVLVSQIERHLNLEIGSLAKNKNVNYNQIAYRTEKNKKAALTARKGSVNNYNVLQFISEDPCFMPPINTKCILRRTKGFTISGYSLGGRTLSS